MKSFLQQLSSFLPPAQILTGEDCAAYEKGWRYGQGKALAVVRPKTTEEVSRIMRLCSEHNISVVPQGGNTGLVGSSTPDETGKQLVLSTTLLNAKDIVLEGCSAKVGAGVVLDQLNLFLEQENLWFPIDIGSSGSCNIGGMIASNAAGTRACRYGNTASRVKEVTVVLASGEVKTYQRQDPKRSTDVLQDNSALDQANPFMGSQGWLGIITEAVIALATVPKACVSALFVPVSDSVMLEIVADLNIACGEYISALESMHDDALKLVEKHAHGLAYPFAGDGAKTEKNDMVFLVELSGDESQHALQSTLENWLMRVFEKGWVVTARADKAEYFWELRHHISEAMGKEGTVTAFDIAVAPEKLPQLRARLAEIVAEITDNAKPIPFGHEVIGAVHYNVLWAVEPTASEKQLLRDAVYDVVLKEFQGSFSAEHNIGPYNQYYYDKYSSLEEKEAADIVKNTYDPDRLLQPNVNFGASS